MLWLSLALCALVAQGTTPPPTVGWTADPDGRGTSGLIVSCVATLFLCVWSSMHLNIPAKGETQLGYWTRCLRWVLLGVLIPELVILAAWRQWLSARRLTHRIAEVLKHKTTSDSGRSYGWSVEHSYFAGMGGFVFDAGHLPSEHQALFSDKIERLTLTASGALLLAQCGHLPDIDGASIKDKSKQDALAKTVVCIQVAWMVGQTIGRLIIGIPVTLLEVNTLGHVFCAFVLYVLWWKKPKEVREPHVLKGTWTAPLAAYMFMSSRMSGTKPQGRIVLKKWIKPEIAELGWYPPHVIEPDDIGRIEQRAGLTVNTDEYLQLGQQNSSGSASTPAAQSTAASIQTSDGELRRRPEKTLTALPKTVITITETRSRETDNLLNNRVHACSEAIRQYPAVRERFRPVEGFAFLKPDTSPLVTTIASNWPSDDLLPGLSGKTMGMALWLSSSLYGGIHLAAWLDFFPTNAEAQLWRLSAGFIAGSGALWFTFCLIASRWPTASDYWHRFVEVRAWIVEYVFIGTIMCACAIAYILARVYLVIEAIVSLRQLPSTAYETPGWSSIWPHL